KCLPIDLDAVAAEVEQSDRSRLDLLHEIVDGALQAGLGGIFRNLGLKPHVLELLRKRPDISRGLAERGIHALISRVADEERDAWTTLNRSLRSWRWRGGLPGTFGRHSGARRGLRAGQGSEPLARGIARPFAASRLVFGRRQHGFEVLARFVGLALSFVGKSP